MSKIEKKIDIFERISILIEQARKKVVVTINQEMVILYWNIGKTIKEKIIKSNRAKYGKQIVNSLSSLLTERYGRGFSSFNLWLMIKFYNNYPILESVIKEFEGLSWTHIINIIPIKDELKRKFYSTLCLKENWSIRTLQNRIKSMLFERTTLSRLPEKTIEMQLKELKEEDRIKVAEYLTKLPLKELLIKKIALSNECC